MRMYAGTIVGLVVWFFGSATARGAPVSYGVEVGFGFEEGHFTPGPSSHVIVGAFHAHALVRLDRVQEPNERFQLVSEFWIMESLHPHRRLMVGLSEGLRVTSGSGRWRFFGQGGVGVGSSALHDPEISELNGWLQYRLYVGAGAVHPLANGSAVSAGYRIVHFSNNSIQQPNLGLNLHLLTVGIQF